VSGLGVRGALLAVRADAGVRADTLGLAARALGLLGVALALAGVPRRDPLAVLGREALHLPALAVDDDADRVPAPLAHAADHLHLGVLGVGLVAVLDGLRAHPADARLAEHLPGLLVEAADLAADLRRRHGLRLLHGRRGVHPEDRSDLGDLLRGGVVEVVQDVAHLYSFLVSIFLHFVQEDINLRRE